MREAVWVFRSVVIRLDFISVIVLILAAVPVARGARTHTHPLNKLY
jgi:hypothetical protein